MPEENSNPSKRPHFRISEDRIDRKRKEGSGFPSQVEDKDPNEQVKMLVEQIENCIKLSERREKITDSEAIFLTVQTTGPIAQEDGTLNRLHMHFSLQLDQYAAIVSLDKEGLNSFWADLEIYSATKKLKSYFNRIERISIVSLRKINQEIAQWLKSDIPASIEIRLLPNLGEGYYEQIITKIKEYLRFKKEKVIGSRISHSIASIRAVIHPKTMQSILQGIDSIWQTYEAPKLLLEEPQSLEFEELPQPRAPTDDIKTVCVLDTGIKETHPYIYNIIKKAVDLTDDNDLEDTKGHGTFVSGLAAYGNLENPYDPKATASLIIAKVRGKNNNGYPYLESRIEKAVEMFHSRAKIFTLSIVYPSCTNTEQPSDLAFTIDNLSNKYDILFTICAGNVKQEAINRVYPSYLSESCCKLYCGAESAMSVTVGGIADRDSYTLAKKRTTKSFHKKRRIWF